MKKICILSAVNIRHMSLISLYTEILQKNGVEFDIIYMDKYGEDEEFPAKRKYVYKNIVSQRSPKWYKILKYFKFRLYATRILNKNNYDFIIVWNDVTIFMFADYLVRKYKNKYCLNIRDYCHQRVKWIYRRFEKVIKSSLFTTISSEGYKNFLPPYNYCTIHSLNPDLFDSVKRKEALRKDGEPIKIGFVGYVRFFETNKALLRLFQNDTRFELHYYGTKANILKEYAETNHINNAVFHDTFPVKDTSKYLNKIDVINNLYGNESISLTTALSIKLYHGIYTRIPILVCPNTYMENVVKKYNVGFVFSEISDEYKEKFYDWYRHLDFENFKINCMKFIDVVQDQNKVFERKIYEIISK